MGFMTLLIDRSPCFDLPTCILSNSDRLHAPPPTSIRSFCIALSNIVTGNQGLLVLNTNVTVSRNLYWSTLSALIAWPGPWDGASDATRLDLKGSPPPHPSSCPAAILSSTVQQHQHVARLKKKKKKRRKFQGSNLSRRVCVSAARPINQSAEGGEQRGRRRRQRVPSVRAGGRARKDASAASRLLFGRLFAEALTSVCHWRRHEL